MTALKLLTEQDRKVLDAAVRRGAARLDETDPPWRSKIDVANLDMAWCTQCVLGQVFCEYADEYVDGYTWGLRTICVRGTPGAFYGFDVPWWDLSVEPHDGSDAWDVLRDLWVKEVQR